MIKIVHFSCLIGLLGLAAAGSILFWVGHWAEDEPKKSGIGAIFGFLLLFLIYVASGLALLVRKLRGVEDPRGFAVALSPGRALDVTGHPHLAERSAEQLPCPGDDA